MILFLSCDANGQFHEVRNEALSNYQFEVNCKKAPEFA